MACITKDYEKQDASYFFDIVCMVSQNKLFYKIYKPYYTARVHPNHQIIFESLNKFQISLYKSLNPFQITLSKSHPNYYN
jgi:hypothetical protein